MTVTRTKTLTQKEGLFSILWLWSVVTCIGSRLSPNKQHHCYTLLCVKSGVWKVTCNETLTTNYNKEHECIFVQKHSVESIKQILQNKKKQWHELPTSKAQQVFTQMRINSKIQLSQLNFGLTDINKDVVIIYTAWFKYTHFKQVHYLNHIHKQIIIRNKKYHLYKIFSLKKSCAHVFLCL